MDLPRLLTAHDTWQSQHRPADRQLRSQCDLASPVTSAPLLSAARRALLCIAGPSAATSPSHRTCVPTESLTFLPHLPKTIFRVFWKGAYQPDACARIHGAFDRGGLHSRTWKRIVRGTQMLSQGMRESAGASVRKASNCDVCSCVYRFGKRQA